MLICRKEFIDMSDVDVVDDGISDFVLESLRDWIDELVASYNDACSNFLIQYTIFRQMDTERNDDGSETQKWYMQCTIENTCEEGIYDMNLTYADDVTEVKVKSLKGNYDDFMFSTDYMSDDYGHCTEYIKDAMNSICAVDLYPNFVPRDYKGEVTTRGGYTGWNYRDIIREPGG